MCTRKKVDLLLQDAMQGLSFKRRGSAYFRVHGEGTLQVVKFDYEHCFDHFALYMGLFSMYDELLEQWFTSSGCIPRYNVLLLIGRRNAVVSESTYTYVIPPEEQIAVFKDKAVDWLDGIKTQEQLVESIRYLDKLDTHKEWWNDPQKIAPFLLSKQYELADRVVNAILYQHLCAKSGKWDWPVVWNKDDYDRFVQLLPDKEEEIFFRIHNWIYNSDYEAIQKYLKENYENNCKFARFCMKKE